MGILNIIISLLASPRHKPRGKIHILFEFSVILIKVLDEIKCRLTRTSIPKIVFNSVIRVRHVKLSKQLYAID